MRIFSGSVARVLGPVSSGRGFARLTTDDEKLAKEHTFIKEKDILNESYISNLQNNQQKEIAHQINRRTEFQVLRTDYESE